MIHRCPTCPSRPVVLSWRLHTRTVRHRDAVTAPPVLPLWLTAVDDDGAARRPAPVVCAPPWRRGAEWWEARCPHTGMLVDVTADDAPAGPPRTHLHPARLGPRRNTQHPDRAARNTTPQGASHV